MLKILYLHGFASAPSSAKARYFRAALESAGAQVEVPDLAEGDFERLTITGQLGVIERAAHNEPVSLIGSSLGGYLAALYAARHSEVRRLVLLAPGFAFARRMQEYLGAEKMEQWRRAGFFEFFHYGENRPRTLRYTLMEDAARYEDFPDFHQPALIFHGAQDEIVPAAGSQQFARAHPNARLEILDSNHDLLNVLDQIAPKVMRFLLEQIEAVTPTRAGRRK